MRYGLCYQGSKNAIAEDIISILPAGRRFVDLFGGGGAMTHCAALSSKWKKILYNEFNPLLVQLFQRAVNGEYKNESRWISRDDFFRLKETEGYIKYCWSFGNGGLNYLYSKELEPWKKALHYARVLGDTSLFAEFGINTDGSRTDIKKNEESYRKKYANWYLKNILKSEDLQSLERLERTSLKSLESLQSLQRLERLEGLERLQNLQRLQGLERLERLEIKQGSYLDYVYKEGDVVYCDPPYENTAKYNKQDFDHKEFYDWVASRPYRVYFSSYDISDNRFFKIWQKQKVKLMNGASSDKATEFLYCNQPDRVLLL